MPSPGDFEMAKESFLRQEEASLKANAMTCFKFCFTLDNDDDDDDGDDLDNNSLMPLLLIISVLPVVSLT